MILADTNIFLEILLKQDKKEICKDFLEKNAGRISITDFSLHSIGVVCFRYRREDTFERFISDILPQIDCVSLPLNRYSEVIKHRTKVGLDFDDSYQYTVAKYFDLKIVTMDNDFKKINDLEIEFL